MNERTVFFAALALLSIPVLGGSRASAQTAEDRDLRLGAHLALGLGGDADLFLDGRKGSAALDPTVGFGLRAELPILDFVSIGGLFEALTFEFDSDTLGRDREWAFDFDAFVRLRYVIELPDAGLFLEPYVLLPLGFSFSMLDDPDGEVGDDEAWPGWNTGVLAGLSVLTSSGLGGFVELGWRHREVYTHVEVPFIDDLDLSLVTNQFALNLGFVAVL